MGGVPCAKILINRRLEAELLAIQKESEATTDLLAAKGFFESPVLTELIDYETELIGKLQSIHKHFASLNDKYRDENEYKE